PNWRKVRGGGDQGMSDQFMADSQNFRSLQDFGSFVSETSEAFHSVELELSQVLFADFRSRGRGQVILVDDAVFQYQGVHAGGQEAAESLLRRTYDRLTADVETGIHEHGTAGKRLEGFQQPVKARVAFFVHGLEAGAVIDVRDGRHRGA